MNSRMNRRSLLAGLLTAPAILAVEAPPLNMEWNRYSITLNDGSTEKGILVRVACASEDVRAFEVSVQWRERFLGLGPLQERRVLVERHEDGRGFCKVITGGEEAWTRIQSWGLHRQEASVSQVGEG